MDFYGRRLHSYKANLHTHSTLSDGEFPPQEVIRLYREHGYSVLAFTDHRKTNPVSGYDGGGLTLLSGIELHPNGPRGIRWHLLALGVPESFPGEFESGQQAVAVDDKRVIFRKKANLFEFGSKELSGNWAAGSRRLPTSGATKA